MRTARAPTEPARRVAMSSRIGRRRLPPAPAMNSPISWISATGDSIWTAIASSTALNSGPTAKATRSFRSASRGVGAFTVSTDHHAVLHLDLRTRGQVLDVDDRELLTNLGDLPGRDLLVQLAQHLASDGVDDGDLVATHAHDAARTDPVAAGQIDHEPGRVHVDDKATSERLGLSAAAVGLRRRRQRSDRAARR